MFAAEETVPNLEVVKVVVVLSAAVLVMFWRTAIKLVIMVLATAVITLLGVGAIVLFESMHL
jgi:hypothetical protein